MEINIEVKKLKTIGITISVLIVIYILSSTENKLFNNTDNFNNNETIWPFCDILYLRDNPFRDPRYYPNQTPNTIEFNGIFLGFDMSDLFLNLFFLIFLIFEINKYVSKKNYLIVISIFSLILFLSMIPEALNKGSDGIWPLTLFRENIKGPLDGFGFSEFSFFTFITIIFIYIIKRNKFKHGK